MLDITHLLLQLIRILSTVGLPSSSPNNHNNIFPFKNSHSRGEEGNLYDDGNKYGDEKFGVTRSVENNGEGNEGYEGVNNDNNDSAAATTALKSLVHAIGMYLRYHRYIDYEQ